MKNSVILNILLLVLQVILCLPLYNVLSFLLDYTLTGTVVIFGVLCVHELYLLVKAIRYFIKRKYMVGLGLILFVIGTMFAYYFVCMVGFIPIVGVTLDGIRE